MGEWCSRRPIRQAFVLEFESGWDGVPMGGVQLLRTLCATHVCGVMILVSQQSSSNVLRVFLEVLTHIVE